MIVVPGVGRSADPGGEGGIMFKRVLLIAAAVVAAGSFSVPTAVATASSKFGVSADPSGCTVTASATWSRVWVVRVDYDLKAEPAGQHFLAHQDISPAQRDGTSTVSITSETSGTATVEASFVKPNGNIAGTATSSSFAVGPDTGCP
jgi:hypothetical protein